MYLHLCLYLYIKCLDKWRFIVEKKRKEWERERTDEKRKEGVRDRERERAKEGEKHA